MKNLFERASSYWVRYDRYELREGKNGIRYVAPAVDAQPHVYNPLKDPEKLVLDALNVGMLSMGRKSEEVIQQGVLDFVNQYGLLGMMPALPTTSNFMDYEAVYLPKNPYIREETMQTEDYLELFFPFEKLDVIKRGVESAWNINQDRKMMALAMTFSDQPMAMQMCFQRQYAERYDWLVAQFKEWAFFVSNTFFYYLDYDRMNEAQRNTLRMGMAAFGGNAPTYHIALYDKPTIVWDFHSLMMAVHMMLSFLLTDEKRPMKLCSYCHRVFIAKRKDSMFCSPKCGDDFRKKQAEKQ